MYLKFKNSSIDSHFKQLLLPLLSVVHATSVDSTLIQEKICGGYADCSMLNAYCKYFEFSMITFTVVNKCECVSGFDHITGLTSYTAADGNDYTSKCDHVSGMSTGFSHRLLYIMFNS